MTRGCVEVPTQPLDSPGAGRVVRGVAVAVVAILLTVAGHAAAGGAVPSVGLLVLFAGLLSCVLVSLGDRELEFGSTVLTVGAAQLCLHVLLSVLGQHHGDATAGAASWPAMITVHVVLTVLCSWLLRGADAALRASVATARRALRRMRRAIGGILQPWAAGVDLGRPDGFAPVAMWVRLMARRICLRRGPPVLI